ncbi:MAG: hypothetical protein ACR2OC_09345 [Solirubrobacterales bacterium]
MTTPRDPRRPRSGGKSGPEKGSSSRIKTPFSRRVKYIVEDSGYALRKAGRRITDPLRDAGPKRGTTSAKSKAADRRARNPSVAEGESPKALDGAPAKGERDAPRRRPPRRPARRRHGQPSPSAARRLGERPAAASSSRRGPRLKLPSAHGVAAAITGFGERASKLILGVLAPLAGPLASVGALAARAFTGLANFLTPLRATIAVTALAAILLAASQFVDYRGVAVGVSDYAAYSDVEAVAPAPQVDRQPTGSAHSYLLLPVAVIALAALAFAPRGRWQLGRVVSLLGLLAIAVTLLVDMPTGLDEGKQAIAYAGVEAKLIEGFYAQFCAAAVMVVGGLLVSRYARLSGRRSPRPRRRTARVAPANARPA